jgi:hypothetical protein
MTEKGAIESMPYMGISNASRKGWRRWEWDYRVARIGAETVVGVSFETLAKQ